MPLKVSPQLQHKRGKNNTIFSEESEESSSRHGEAAGGEAEGLLQEPMAGARGGSVGAVHGRRRVPLRRHLAGAQGRPRVQPAAAGRAGRRQEPRGLRRRRRRHALGRAAAVGDAAHGRRAEPPRLRLALAHRRRPGAGAAHLDGERASLRC